MNIEDDFEYTLTRKALRQIKAEAWAEGRQVGVFDYANAIIGFAVLPTQNPYETEEA